MAQLAARLDYQASRAGVAARASALAILNRWGRGAFRYLTLSLGAQASPATTVELQLSHVYFTADPNNDRLQVHSGYFRSSDDLLNRIWYAGAYTGQLCTVAANTSVNHTRLLEGIGWSNDQQVTGLNPTDSILSDGAKPTVNIRAYGSDTYHLWTITGFAEYVLASSDVAFGRQYWTQIVRGLEGTYPYVNPTTGLFNGTRRQDWGRVGQAGQNIALNALYRHALQLAARVSGLVSNNSTAQASQWQTMAERVKASQMNSFSTALEGRQLYPQDGNVAAINFNLTNSRAQALTIVENLSRRLTQYGSPAPELPGSISAFVGSQELRAQFTASPATATRALALLRTQWGYMLNAFSNSTSVEGYSADESLNYGFYPGGQGFISYVHAWSTGPVYPLLTRIIGLRVSAIDVPAEDGDWVFQPAVVGSGLTFAQGGFRTKDGNFAASWKISRGRFYATDSVPAGSSGTFYVPVLDVGKETTVKVDGKRVRSAVLLTASFDVRMLREAAIISR
ncbi:hypothetical protein H2199_000861 [Coniosporium tulheliwenetii]|uniref:Uncharacterized protein n=1 Tax=Coniosporium tulheliwenetii TaxID=3383036 RepID=A0ACC2ZNI5_9PEZI|nr:hypothetical protein H2199_000861 [Cladosporium sp. JES 115]